MDCCSLAGQAFLAAAQGTSVAVSQITCSGKHAMPAASRAVQLQLSPNTSGTLAGLWQLPPAGRQPDDDGAAAAFSGSGAADGSDGMAPLVAGLVQQADGEASLALWQVGSSCVMNAHL